MPKVNTWMLPRAKTMQVSITLKEPGEEDCPPITMTLRALSFPEASAAADVGQGYANIYSGTKPDGTPRRFASIDGPMELGSKLCVTLATIEAMQVVENEEDRYNFADLVGLSVRYPIEFSRLLEVTGELMEVTVQGNSSRALPAQSSEAPSSADTPTPSGATSSQPSSGASTNASASSRPFNVIPEGMPIPRSQELTPSVLE